MYIYVFSKLKIWKQKGTGLHLNQGAYMNGETTPTSPRQPQVPAPTSVQLAPDKPINPIVRPLCEGVKRGTGPATDPARGFL